MNDPQCQCCKKIAAVQVVVWEQIETLSLLIKRIEREGDRLQELYREAEHDRYQARVAMWEKHLRNNIAAVDKNGR
jgi:hypothetical protein